MKTIKTNIKIKGTERNRKDLILDESKYYLFDVFKEKILPKCNNRKLKTEILKEQELERYTTDEEIKKDNSNVEISADEIIERILQNDFKKWTIIGYCNGLVVHANPRDDGRVHVYAFELDVWSDGDRLLSRELNLNPLILKNSELSSFVSELKVLIKKYE